MKMNNREEFNVINEVYRYWSETGDKYAANDVEASFDLTRISTV